MRMILLMNNLFCKTRIMKKDKKTPNYDIFLPKEVSVATKSELTPIEMRVYNEILAQSHLKDDGQLIYHISAESIYEGYRKGRSLQDLSHLTDRTFIFRADFMKKYFDDESNYIVTPIPTIRIPQKGEQYVEVHINPIFKKILTLIDKNIDTIDHKGIPYVKGSIDDLRTFRFWFTHKFYWLLREEQDKTVVTNKDYFDISVEDLKERLSCVESYANPQSFKRALTKALKEVEATFVELIDYKDLKKGMKVVNNSNRRTKTLGFRFIFKHSIREVSEKVKRKEKFRWEDDLRNFKVSKADIDKLKRNVIEEKENKTKTGTSFTFTNEYVEQCIQIGRKDIYSRNMLKDGKSPVKNTAKWIIRGIIEGWWIENYKQEEKKIAKRKEAKTVKKQISSTGSPFVIGDQQTILYSQKEIEDMHKNSQWANYDIKHFLGGFIKIISLEKYAPKESINIFKNLGMPIEIL